MTEILSIPRLTFHPLRVTSPRPLVHSLMSMTARPDTSGGRHRVVILGAGFGGIGAAKELKKSDVDVVLVDGHDYHTFQPLLYQVATSLLNAEDVGAPIRGLFRRQTICVSTLKKSLSGVELKYVSEKRSLRSDQPSCV